MQPSSAYLLVSHGSRDPRPQIAADHLAKLVMQRSPHHRLQSRSGSSTKSSAANPLVGTAVLELGPLPLEQQIQQFAARASAAGYRHLRLLPLFLLPGVHVMEDIPATVAIARQTLGSNMTLEVCPYLGSHPRLRDLLINPVDPIASSPQTGRILIAHGSRRSGANQPVEAIAAGLNALPAYWSVSPELESQVTTLVKIGCQQIAILPYFLFSGGITDAIAQTVAQLAQQFPYTHFHLANPLGATPALADLVIELAFDTEVIYSL